MIRTKPSTQKEKDELFDGYEEFSRLQKGIIESDDDKDNEDIENDDHSTESRDQMESFIPPANWGLLMTNNKQTQVLFEERLKQQREKFFAEQPPELSQCRL